MRTHFKIAGRFHWERWTPSGLLLARGTFANGIPTAARTALLDAYFNAGSAFGTSYMGLIDNDTLSVDPLSDSDTMASHPGWQEVTAYSSATRPAWGQGAATAAILSNANLVLFTLSAAKNVGGLFLTNNSTKGGTSGVLWATGLGDQVQQMAVGEILRCSYTLEASSP